MERILHVHQNEADVTVCFTGIQLDRNGHYKTNETYTQCINRNKKEVKLDTFSILLISF